MTFEDSAFNDTEGELGSEENTVNQVNNKELEAVDESVDSGLKNIQKRRRIEDLLEEKRLKKTLYDVFDLDSDDQDEKAFKLSF